MARLHEHQGKAILARHGIPVPRGRAAGSPDQAAIIARSLGGHAVVKIQAWTTGRAGIGGIAFAETPEQAANHAGRMLAMRVGRFVVTQVLVEEKLVLAGELFISLTIDDRSRAPVLLLAASGGTGIEQRASNIARVPCDVRDGPKADDLRAAIDRFKSEPALRDHLEQIAEAARATFRVARAIEARSFEINPLGITTDGRLIALDCRITVDDYAVFRHEELGIDVAREFDHPPTKLERSAYRIEQEDHRGTFYFVQMADAAPPGSRGLIGFHGAGGGGSMMSMDAVSAENFTLANFTDTSGNPSAAKVYRAARVVLSQPNLVGYFGSGSGVASQEQFWSAYGLAKAFWELELSIPAVIRLGGNSEDRAVDILQSACRALPTTVEGYKKDDPPAKVAHRFAELVAKLDPTPWHPRKPRRPTFVGSAGAISFPLKAGKLWLDAANWPQIKSAIVANAFGLIRDDNGKPLLTVSESEIASKDSELIGCEVECRRSGVDGIFVDLDIPGLDEFLE